MNVLVTLALIGLAAYWGWLLVPKFKSLVTKIKQKFNKTPEAKETTETKENN